MYIKQINLTCSGLRIDLLIQILYNLPTLKTVEALMLTKNEKNKLSIRDFIIKDEKELDLCIEHLTNEVKHCSIHFAANNLPEEKLITLPTTFKISKITH